MSTGNTAERELVYVALGGNVGSQPEILARMRRALELLRDVPGITVNKRSSVYRTPAWGLTNQPDFLNAVVEADASLEPAKLLDELKTIEQELGRQKRERWGPREIDLDILLFGSRIVDNDELSIPHPGLLQRAFVLLPLLELAPNVCLPDGREIRRVAAEVISHKQAILRTPDEL
jgi:2-amino-4-hydroxy-6-hydroxymethyldihydropteridine diphosphokinase